MSEEEWFDIVIHAPPGRQDKTYKMRFSKWKLDMAHQTESMDARGTINNTALWMKRLCFVVQGMTEEQVGKMETWEMNTLITYWVKYNETDRERFLEILPMVGKENS